MQVEIKIVNDSPNPLPDYATCGSSGMDLRAYLYEPLSLAPLEKQLYQQAFQLNCHEGYEAQIRPRSGLALKQGITCLNSPGTIDSDYRGEIKIILINLSKEQQVIHPGDRIAQLVIQKVEKIQWNQVNTLTETQRSDGGFGSTGKY